MGGDDELDLSTGRKFPEHPEKRYLHPRGEGILGFVEQVQSPDPETVREECHVRLTMRLSQKGALPEIFKRCGISDRPFVEDLGKVAEYLRCEEGSLNLITIDPDMPVEEILAGVDMIPPSRLVLPDVDAAFPGDGLEERRFAAPVLADEKCNGL